VNLVGGVHPHLMRRRSRRANVAMAWRGVRSNAINGSSVIPTPLHS
jgi:hypothetical protein